MTHDMIYGFPPFFADTIKELNNMIIEDDLELPGAEDIGYKVSSEIEEFITLCLNKDPKERLGGKAGVTEILSHKWFSDLNMDDLINKKIEAEYKVKLSEDMRDLSNFDVEFTSLNMDKSLIMDDILQEIKNNEDAFKNF